MDYGSRAGSEPTAGPSSAADPPAPSLQALMKTNPGILKTIQVNEPQGTKQLSVDCV